MPKEPKKDKISSTQSKANPTKGSLKLFIKSHKKAVLIIGICVAVLAVTAAITATMVKVNKNARVKAESEAWSVLEYEITPAYTSYMESLELDIESSEELDDPSNLPSAQDCIRQNSATHTIERMLEIQEYLFDKGNGIPENITNDGLAAYTQEMRDGAQSIKDAAVLIDKCTSPIRTEAQQKRQRIEKEEAERKAAEEAAAKAAEEELRRQKQLDLEKFNNIKVGMNLATVKSMFAFDSLCELTVDTGSGQSYTCDASSSYNIKIATFLFMNGRLYSKGQTGL